MAAPLVYALTASVDGYIAGPDDGFGWAFPDDEVHRFFNDLIRPTGIQLYGRRMYEVMAAWEDFDLDALPPAEREFAELWRATDKIVYSTTLADVSTTRTELRSAFDPDEVRRLKESTDRPTAISGGRLASAAARAGLLDEIHLVVAPSVVGGGTRFLDEGLDLPLELVADRRFASGFAYLGYRVATRPAL